MRECSGSFKDVSSNTVICFWGIPQEFRRKMIVLLDTSDKDPLHSHCYQVNDCQKNNFVNKRRLAFLYWKKSHPPFSNEIVYVLKGGRHFCTRKKCHHLSVTNAIFQQWLRKCAPPFITKILLLQSFTW